MSKLCRCTIYEQRVHSGYWQSFVVSSLFSSAYLPCEIQSWDLGNSTVHLPKHLTQLGNHGGKVVGQGLHWLLKDGAHSLRGNKRSAVLPLNNLWRRAISICHSKITGLVAHVSDSPPQLESRWATYWASFVWEQRLAAEPPPPESRKAKKFNLNERNKQQNWILDFHVATCWQENLIVAE